MKVGEIKVAEDSDFQELRILCRNHDGWDQVYSKNGITVWTKSNENTSFKMIKLRAVIPDVSCCLVYDVLHDGEYRKSWDHNMLEGYELCYINPNNDIGYYALKMPKPLRCRDFVMQRSWLATDKEYMIVNHSVNHKSLPLKKGFVRGISYITGYHITPCNEKGLLNQPGCDVAYVTLADPRGKLPSWIVNKACLGIAPKSVKRLLKACRGYDAWKSQQRKPNYKPWLNPEQLVESIPRMDSKDILSMDEVQQAEIIDETAVSEENGVREDEDGDD